MGNGKKRAKKTNICIKTGVLLDLGGIKKMERGKQYLDDGRVLALEFLGTDAVKASVYGEKKYSVTITGEDEPKFRCLCPSFENDGFCKHCVAVALAAEQGVAFETISKTYVQRLIGEIHRIEDKVKPNPGDEIAHALNEMGVAETGAVGTHGEYRYRQTEKGLVIWGGSSAMSLLGKFDLLRLKDGFRIDGYYFFDGMGGNFRPGGKGTSVSFAGCCLSPITPPAGKKFSRTSGPTTPRPPPLICSTRLLPPSGTSLSQTYQASSHPVICAWTASGFICSCPPAPGSTLNILNRPYRLQFKPAMSIA